MHKSKWNARIAATATAAFAFFIVSVWAQRFDDGTELLAEELTIEDALQADLNGDADLDALLRDAEKGVGIDDTLFGEDPWADAEAFEFPEAVSLDEADPFADMGSLVDMSEMGALEFEDADLAVDAEAAPAEMSEDLGAPAFAAEAGFDDMGWAEVDQALNGDAAPAAEADPFAVGGWDNLFMDEPAADAALAAEPVAEEVSAEMPVPAVVDDPWSMPAAEVAVPAPVMSAPAAVTVAATPPAPMDPRARSIEVLREGEELRRRAFAQHAAEKLVAADAAFKARNYTASQRLYDQAAQALDQAGGRAEHRADLRRARTGALESLYRRATEMRRDGDYESALKLAREAGLQGHPDAANLVRRIEEDQVKPAPTPPKDPPRWKQDDYREKMKEVTEKLRKGRDHFNANELDLAQEQFEAVLNIDAHNTEAIRWREKVTQLRYDRASMELETTRQDMMTRVRETWNPRDYGAGEPTRVSGTDDPGPQPDTTPQERILRKMELILIPEIDFRQANIHDVVQFLQDASIEFDQSPGARGVNFILKLSSGDMPMARPAAPADPWGMAVDLAPAAPAGTELITFRAREISLLEALRIVTDVANLKFRVDGNVVMILPYNAPDAMIIHRMYDVLPTMTERIATVRESSGGTTGGRSDFISLGGGEIADTQTDWKAFFQEMGVQWPIGSSIKHVPAIGKLMVANTADNLAIFEQRLTALNVVPKQIEIEARFVEVNQTDLNALGFEWNLTDPWEMAYKKNEAGLPMAQRQRIQMNSGSFTTGNRYLGDLAANEQAPDNMRNATANLLSIASVLTNPELSFVLHALEQKGNADLLSAPKVTTQSGIEATIKVVTEYIYPSDYTIEPGVSPTLNSDGTIQTAGTPPVVTPAEFQTREVGVILSVLPEVSTEGEMINLTMSPEVVTEPTWRNYGQTFTDAAGNVLQIPIEQPFFHSRSISTSILIYNGATVVMGGMITEERIQVDDKIPFLGDLPIIGRLFRSKYDNSVKKNLLIFVTARLVDPAGRQVGRTRDVAGGAELVMP